MHYVSVIWMFTIVIDKHIYGDDHVTNISSTSRTTIETTTPTAALTTENLSTSAREENSTNIFDATTAEDSSIRPVAADFEIFEFSGQGTASTTPDQRAIPAYDGQFPYVCRIYLNGLTSFAACTGTIIKEGLIMTSGKCCKWKSPSSEIVLGRVDHRPYVEKFAREGYSIYAIAEKYISDYQHGSGQGEKNEICVVTVADWSKRDGHTVMELEDKPVENLTSCLVVGWGRRGENYSPNVLSYSEVNAYVCGDYYCVNKTKKARWEAGSPMICSGKLVGMGIYFAEDDYLKSSKDDTSTEYYSRLAGREGFIKRMKCSSYPVSGISRRACDVFLVLLFSFLLSNRRCLSVPEFVGIIY